MISFCQYSLFIEKKHFSFLQCFFLCRDFIKHNKKVCKATAANFYLLKALYLLGAVIVKLLCLYLLVNLFISSARADTACLSAQQQLEQVDEWVTIAKVIDGDTVHLKDGRKVRFIGINTPEIGRKGKASQPFARKAFTALKKILAQSKTVGLSYDRDRKDHYQRRLAYISLKNGLSVGQELLRQGLAHAIAIPPNTKYINCYREIEEKARALKLGLWTLAQNQLISAHDLSSGSKGYRFISAEVTAYSESRKSIYLKLTSKLSVRISKKDKHYFSALNLKSLPGKKVLLRGWVSSYKGRQSIYVRSAIDISVL